MRLSSMLAAIALAAPLAAQTHFVPSDTPAVGTCNVIPFGSTSLLGYGHQKYQMKVTAADLGGLPGLLTGLGFAPCSTATVHFDALEVVIDSHPAGQPLSTSFAANLTPNAVTVLSASDYAWNTTANVWNEIGLQNYFPYNGVDDLVIQITNVNGVTVGSNVAGFHRDVRQRLYWASTTGPAPATGTLGNAAAKIAVDMAFSQVVARISSHGIGCVGSNGAPLHLTSGTAQIGQTLGFGIGNGASNGFAILLIGFSNGTPPFPLELSSFGMPGCRQYTDTASTRFAVLDGAGNGSVPLTIPNDPSLFVVKLYSQFACIDPAANATAITTSNYNRILIGS